MFPKALIYASEQSWILLYDNWLGADTQANGTWNYTARWNNFMSFKHPFKFVAWCTLRAAHIWWQQLRKGVKDATTKNLSLTTLKKTNISLMNFGKGVKVIWWYDGLDEGFKGEFETKTHMNMIYTLWMCCVFWEWVCIYTYITRM